MSEKVYLPETIEESPFPIIGMNVIESGSTTVSTTKDTYDTERVPNRTIPYAIQYPDVLSVALDTRARKIRGNFNFTPTGAISIGKYQDGVSGQIDISPDGIVATNSDGDTTFTLDGTTGDAYFAGTIQAGAVVAGEITVSGAFVVNDGSNNIIWLGYLSGGF